MTQFNDRVRQCADSEEGNRESRRDPRSGGGSRGRARQTLTQHWSARPRPGTTQHGLLSSAGRELCRGISKCCISDQEFLVAATSSCLDIICYFVLLRLRKCMSSFDFRFDEDLVPVSLQVRLSPPEILASSSAQQPYCPKP